MVDVIAVIKIQGVELQALYDGQDTKLIKSFKIMYGSIRGRLVPFEDPVGTEKIFHMDEALAPTSIHRFIFNKEIYTRYVRIVPLDYTDVCLKMEIIGCPKRVIRDLWCKPNSYDIGYEAHPYYKFLMNEEHRLDSLERFNISTEQCLEHCKKVGCLSFTHISSTGTCSVHFGHKYTPEFRKWWIKGTDASAISYQRLCFKDIEEVDTNTCGGNVFLYGNANDMTLTSPGFPFQYEEGLKCIWTVKSDMYIEIEFLSILLKETAVLSDDEKIIYDINPGTCKDSLSLKDKSGPEMKITGQGASPTGTKILSVSKQVDITLITCYHFGMTGDKSFELKLENKDSPGCGAINKCTTNCAYPKAFLMTPGFPSYYQPNDTCLWKIRGTFDCPVNWHAFGYSCYSVRTILSGVSWIEAEEACQTFGDHLVSIGDQSEMAFVHYLLTVLFPHYGRNQVFIGLKKKTNSYHIEDFVWSDNSRMTFTAGYYDAVTGKTQPDGLQNEQCFIIDLFSIHNMNDWHDVSCTCYSIPTFICETTNVTHAVKANCSGLFRCRNSNLCISRTKVCNGVAECPQFDDELLCDRTCQQDCECHGVTMKCDFHETQNLTFPLETRKLDLSNLDLHDSTIILVDNILLAEMNLSSSMFSDMNNLIFGTYHNLLSLDLSYNNIEVIPKYAFQGLRYLRTLLFDGNFLLHTIYPHSFSGLSRLPSLVLTHANLISLPKDTFKGLDNLETLNLSDNSIQNIDSQAFAGLRSLKNLDIQKNRITEFSDGIFLGLESLESIVSDVFVFCCLKPVSVKDESCFPEQDEFSSCSDMIKDATLRVCLWIIGLCGLVGNFTVVVYRIYYDKESLLKHYGIFIMSLHIADFLMGLYAIIIASADAVFRGTYFWNNYSWRFGGLCKLAGMLSLVSSSVLFQLLITIDRFIIIKYPFVHLHFDKIVAQCISGFVFLISLVIAIIPMVPGSYFDGNLYSGSAVCIALPLTHVRTIGWEFSFGTLIAFNFLLFVIIAGFQLMIYREITGTIPELMISQKRDDFAISQNIFLVVFSDFLELWDYITYLLASAYWQFWVIWNNLTSSGVMVINGYLLPEDVYTWTAIFILPVNSAINPILCIIAVIKQKVSSISRLQTTCTKRNRRRKILLAAKKSHEMPFRRGATISGSSIRYTTLTNCDNTLQYAIRSLKKCLAENSLKSDDINNIINKLMNMKETFLTDEISRYDELPAVNEEKKNGERGI